MGKRKQVGSVKLFLRHASNHLRGCLSRYTESVNVSNSCLSTEVHSESSAAADQPLQNRAVSKTLCAPLLCAGSSPAGCSPQLSHSGWPLGLGDHPGAPGSSLSSPDGLKITFHPGKAAWWCQGPTAPPLGKARDGSEGGDDGLQRTQGFALRARGHFSLVPALPPTTSGPRGSPR